jgi:hypothetical protein
VATNTIGYGNNDLITVTSKFLASLTNIFGCDSGKEIVNVNEPQAIFSIVMGESQVVTLAA